ncbi:nucleoside deaminase [Streptomyces durocortorensis]|uniref:Nucleoside deaminase n=1 Tax=Streptomyces durocortorensis TaxID=2811104 RepID=A0ABS2I6S1_9ACTN|nr:nucleoside deaminase [Streptomyces durocortorensis]MBM7058861.1 nucleoside deaminase [Streptomyces durocortorensis]
MRTQESELLGFAHEAIRLSREHVAQGGIPFSGVVVGNGRILGTGFNRVREDNDPTAHAEVVALREATTRHGIRAVAGATLIASGEPCALCYLAARYAGIGHIVHAADRRTAARYGFDYTSTYSLFAEDPADWPLKVTALHLPEAEEPFQDFLTQNRAG